MTALEKAAKRPVDILIPYLGYGEKDSNTGLDRMDTFGHNNYTFIAEFFDKLWNAGIKWYNTRKQGAEWCDMTFDYAQCIAWGYETALKVVYQPMQSCGAGCEYSARYYRDNNAWTNEPKTGDQIFFGKKGKETHTGIVEKVEGGKVYTIEGNTSDRLLGRTYSLDNANIAGYGRPNYKLVEHLFTNDGEEMNKEQVEEIARKVSSEIVENKIEETMGKMIYNINDIPWKSVRKEMRQLLDAEAIDGGTPYNENPDDIGLPLNIVRALVAAKRYVVHAIVGALKDE